MFCAFSLRRKPAVFGGFVALIGWLLRPTLCGFLLLEGLLYRIFPIAIDLESVGLRSRRGLLDEFLGCFTGHA